MQLLDGIEEFIECKQAQRLSPRTIEDYEGTLKRFAAAIEKDTIEDIGVRDVRRYLGSLPVSKKRVKNIHITLSSFWTWAVSDGICDTHIPRLIKPPRPEKRVIVPISKLEMKALLAATDYADLYSRRGRQIRST